MTCNVCEIGNWKKYWILLYFRFIKKKIQNGFYLSGHGDSNSKNLPTCVKDVSGVGQVACGSSHTIAVSQDGKTVWSFGGGDNGNYSNDKLNSFMTFFLL